MITLQVTISFGIVAVVAAVITVVIGAMIFGIYKLCCWIDELDEHQSKGV